MKRITLLLALLLVSCTPFEGTSPLETPQNGTMPASVSPALPATESVSTSTPANSTGDIKLPPLQASWHIQYNGDINLNLDVDVYNLDLFETAASDIALLQERGVYVMCYFSAGSLEDWRPDAEKFPPHVVGSDMDGWPGEKWLDIRQIEVLAPVMEARLDLAREKGCDGVDPDNVNGYTNETGFPFTGQDQLEFNIWLSEAAHARGLAIGLKNDIDQIPDLLPYFDWELNEQCFYYNECEALVRFVQAGKPVFNIEYELNTSEFCEEALELGFNSIRKNMELDEYSESCR